MNIEIGPRQTVDRCKHPTLGEGTAVYDNGPAFFTADSGEVVPCLSIGFGGWSSGPPQRSYLVAMLSTGARVELETLGMDHGDRHWRAWHSIHGSGWLVNILSRKVEKAMVMRFEPDGGKPFEFMATGWAVGRPATVAKRERKFARSRTGKIKDGPMDPEDRHWTTYPLTTGETIAFRDAPPVEAASEAAPAPVSSRQMEMFK